MITLLWAENAYDDLFRIADFLDAESGGASAGMLEGVLVATGLLVQHPKIGPAIMGSRIRKWPVGDYPFLLLYQIDGDCITIVRVAHSRSGWQGLL